MLFLKIKFYIFLGLFVLNHLISDSASCSEWSENAPKRQKRSLICFFGLTGLLKEAVHYSLNDLHQYDPLDLGDVAEYKLKNGVLEGLSSLANLSSIEVYCNDQDLVVFSGTLGMRDVRVCFEWRRRALFTFDGTVGLRARAVAYALEVQLNSTGGLTFRVSNSLLTRVDAFEVRFTGMWVLNPVIRGTVNMVYKIWRGRIIPRLEGLMKDALEAKLGEIAETLGLVTHFV